MNVKRLILFLTLLIPVFIFLFLKIFGTNTFEIPSYYSDGIDSEYCGIQTSEPYRLDVTETTLFYSHSSKNSYLEMVINQIVRLKDKSNISIVGLEDMNKESIPHSDGVLYRELLPNVLVDYVSCSLLIINESPYIFDYLVLVDMEGVIRGYYNSGDVEEYDRLFAEIDILDLEN